MRYVKRNAIAGCRFDSVAALDAHLAWWMREVADVRRTARRARRGGAVRARRGGPARAVRRPPFGQLRHLIRKVAADCTVALDTNAYSVP